MKRRLVLGVGEFVISVVQYGKTSAAIWRI
jgi:hypothetical protein